MEQSSGKIITTSRLTQIIKEEANKILNEKREKERASWFVVGSPVAGKLEIKREVLKIKDWLKTKKKSWPWYLPNGKNEIDAEALLTDILIEEISNEIKKQKQ